MTQASLCPVKQHIATSINTQTLISSQFFVLCLKLLSHLNVVILKGETDNFLTLFSNLCCFDIMVIENVSFSSLSVTMEFIS